MSQLCQRPRPVRSTLGRPACAIVLAGLVSIAGCANITGHLPVAKPIVPPPAEFTAGAATVDITPMPGYSMGGFAVAGQDSRGVWTRLKARAVCMADPAGTALALVSADLWAIPGGLSDKVAQLVATTYGTPELSREQIVIAAIHTHNSPGNFASSQLYNLLAQPRASFDEALFDFLSRRIAASIATACRRRQPARLVAMETALGGLSRNRSLEPFLANGADAQAILAENASLPIHATAFPVDPRAYRAIDPTLHLIRVEGRTGGEPVALLGFFPVHPTAMGPTTRVYSADLFGVAARIVERDQPGAVMAFFNGAEGDVAANWQRQDRPATIALGTQLATAVLELNKQPGRDVTGPLKYRFGKAPIGVDHEAMAGAGMFAGSEADWGFQRDAGWREGLVSSTPKARFEYPYHWPKMDPLDESLIRSVKLDLSAIIGFLGSLPDQVPVGVYGLGRVTLATLPGEFTTVLGRRIRQRVAQATQADDPVILIGLANEYLSYFTTEEEHALQHYEGGSMLFGTDSPGIITDTLADLAAKLHQANEPRDEIELYNYHAGWKGSFGVGLFSFALHSGRLKAIHDTLGNVLADPVNHTPVVDNPFFVWIDKSPRWPYDKGSDFRTTPRVWIEAKAADGSFAPFVHSGEVQDDEGFNFVTSVVGTSMGWTRWNSTWMVPAGVDPQAALRFCVDGTSNSDTVCSKEFTLQQVRPRYGFVDLKRMKPHHGS